MAKMAARSFRRAHATAITATDTLSELSKLNSKIAAAEAGATAPTEAQITLAHGSTGSALVPLAVSASGALATTAATTAFGEARVAKMTPTSQLTFRAGVDIPGFSTTHTFGAGTSATSDGRQAKIESGTSNNGFARLYSQRLGRYHAGAGSVARFAGFWETPNADSTQISGLAAGTENGLFFGYNGEDFGVMRRSGGERHIEEMTITSVSFGGNITVELDGETTVVTTSALATIQEQAQEIASHDYSGVGQGWTAYATSNVVTFLSDQSAALTGSYSIAVGATGMTYTTSTLRAGVAPTDNWTLQSSWNLDTMDGTGPSGITLNPETGNVYQMALQWLGYGAITYSIANPATGAWVDVHREAYSNTSTSPHTENPTMGLMFECRNSAAGTTSAAFQVSSAASFTEGEDLALGPMLGAEGVAPVIDSGNVVHVLSVRNDAVVNDVTGSGVMRLLSISAGFAQGGGVAQMLVRIHRGGTETIDPLIPLTWENGQVLASKSSTETTLTDDGDVLYSRPVRSNQSFDADVSGYNIDLYPGEYVVFSVEASADIGHSGTIGTTWSQMV